MQLKIDITSWSQEEINFIHAACSNLLHKAGITFSHLKAIDGVIYLENESADPKAVLTSKAIRARIAEHFAELEIANEQARVEEEKRKQEFKDNFFAGLTLDGINEYIDKINTLAELKVVLMEMARFIKAKLG